MKPIQCILAAEINFSSWISYTPKGPSKTLHLLSHALHPRFPARRYTQHPGHYIASTLRLPQTHACQEN